MMGIDAFMKRYWTLPRIMSASPQKYKQFLEKKFGVETLNEQSVLEELACQDETGQCALNITDFYYRTGLCDWIFPDYQRHKRATLSQLLKNLEYTDKPIYDFGSGDGAISVGLALGLEDVPRVHCVDTSRDGLERTRQRIEELPRDWRKIAKEKIEFANCDYACPSMQGAMESPKVIVVANPFSTKDIVPTVEPAMKEKDRLLLVFTLHKWQDQLIEERVDAFQDEWRAQIERSTLSFRPARHYAVELPGNHRENRIVLLEGYKSVTWPRILQAKTVYALDFLLSE